MFSLQQTSTLKLSSEETTHAYSLVVAKSLAMSPAEKASSITIAVAFTPKEFPRTT